jgi:hypothetical protein
MKTDTMKTTKYRLPDKPKKTVAAFVLCTTGEATLLFVPSFDGERPDVIVVAHDDAGTGVYEDAEMNWFNVESKDMAEIGTNLGMLASKLR